MALKNYQFRVSAAQRHLTLAVGALQPDNVVAHPTVVADGSAIDIVYRYEEANLADLQAAMEATGATYVGEVIP